MSDFIHGDVAEFSTASKGKQHARMSQSRALMVEQSLPRLTDLALHKKIYAANTGAGTALAPVATMPTTAAAWGLYNGYQDNTHLVILRMTCHSVSGTLGLGMALLGCHAARQTTASATYTNSIKQNISGNGKVSAAIFAGGVTLDEAPVWITLASGDQVSAISVGSGYSVDVEGLFVIPPGHLCGLTVLAPVGSTALFNAGFVWAEVKLEAG